MLYLYQYWGHLGTSLFGLSCITFCYIFLPITDDAEFKGTQEKLFNQNLGSQIINKSKCKGKEPLWVEKGKMPHVT